MRLMKRLPAACEAIDIAGIGEKPKIRSGPWVFAVWTCAAATISRVSSQDARTRPPLPRAFWYRRRVCGSPTTAAHASTGSGCVFFAAR